MSRIRITDTTAITGAAPYHVQHGVDVVIVDDRIHAIEPTGTTSGHDGDDVIDGRLAIVMPGLVDTHLHAWEYAWRGTTVRKTVPKNYMELLWLTHGAYEPEDVRDSIVGASLELIDHGVTGVLDFMHGANISPDHTTAALDAYRFTGQRAVVHIGTTAKYTEPDDVFSAARTKRIADVARLRTEAGENPLVDAAVALITPAPPRWHLFAADVNDSRDIGARMTFHANEQGELMRMAKEGLLGSDLVPSHGNRASAPELAAMADNGVILSQSPYTEIGSGKSTAVANRAARAGVRLAISIDTPPSVSPLNEFTQLYQFWTSLVLNDQAVAREGARFPIDYELDPQTMSLDQAFETATGNGALALGYTDLGRLEPGCLADVIVVRPQDPAAALADPVAFAVLSQPSSRDVTDVVIHGHVRKRDGELVIPDGYDRNRTNARVRERIMTIIQA